MAYPNLKKDPELLKIKTRDDEIKDLRYRLEKHDHENSLESLKIDHDYHKNKYKGLNKKKVFLTISETLLGGAPTITTSTLSVVIPIVGIIISSSTALLSSIAILSTNEYISKLKIRSTKLKDWINVINLLYEKTLKQSMVDEKKTKT